jgi:glycosyltransferase involved in cell wall biosynthesis
MKDVRVKYVEYPLKKDFASFKNNLIRQATGDYCFLIDADELIHPNLLVSIKEILNGNPDIEMFILPRFNVVLGLTSDYAKSQGWNVVTMNIQPDEFIKSIGIAETVVLVNPFDPQQRIWKNSPRIRYEGSVHERLTGYATETRFDNDFNWMIYHIKSLHRQQKQNEFYEQFR